MPKTVPELPGIPAGTLPFSKVVEANGFVFLAGQVGDVAGTPGAVPGGIEAETRQMLDNVVALLQGRRPGRRPTLSRPRSISGTSATSRR